MVKFIIPGLPPSVNDAWFHLPGGGKTLKTAGKKYVAEVKTMLGREYTKELMTFRQNEPYLVFWRLHMKNVENETWGAAKKGAKTRYKKIDGTNRIKILEDVIAEVTNIDDSCTLTFGIQKVKASDGNEKTEIFIWNTYREESPFDEPLSRL